MSESGLVPTKQSPTWNFVRGQFECAKDDVAVKIRVMINSNGFIVSVLPIQYCSKEICLSLLEVRGSYQMPFDI